MDPITNAMKSHYSQKFEMFGPCSRGVDWGSDESVLLRYEKMVEVIDKKIIQSQEDMPTVLDVGCGYGGLLSYLNQMEIPVKYTGIDICDNMIRYANEHHSNTNASFICGDIFELDPSLTFDYVICNGILTQKLSSSILNMDDYCKKLIRKMYSFCRKGISFNVMTTKVNFMVDNLYYKNPIELFAFCFTEISHHIKVDHSYPLYEYTIYIYR